MDNNFSMFSTSPFFFVGVEAADVLSLCHLLQLRLRVDALLGAAALRDIGRHFPDTDPQYKGISSILLLQKVGALLKEKGYQIVNIDATIIAQKPKLLPHIDQMIKNVADALELSEDQVNIKATTEEGLGFTGTLQGISSQAICCIQTAQD